MGSKIIKNTIPEGLAGRRRLLRQNGRRALDAGARVIRARAARSAPVDTSRLVNSLRAKDGLQVLQGATTARGAADNPPKPEDVINRYKLRLDKHRLDFGTGVPYAAAQEFGNSRSAPKLFFSEAFDQGANQSLKAVAKVITNKVIN